MMPQWHRDENPDFDVAALRVAPNQLGVLTDVIGARGYVTGRSRHVDFQIFGYPAAALGGEELRSCLAKGLGSDVLTYRLVGPPTVPGSCDMAGGSSGGAWIVGGEYIDGVTSYGYTGSGNKVYWPVLRVGGRQLPLQAAVSPSGPPARRPGGGGTRPGSGGPGWSRASSSEASLRIRPVRRPREVNVVVKFALMPSSSL